MKKCVIMFTILIVMLVLAVVTEKSDDLVSKEPIAENNYDEVLVIEDDN